jgi:coenzyme F420-0:L-glutamate ligase/coenzyme F420-1:gamma-L-glutamate ligase
LKVNAFTVDNIPLIKKDDDIADIICQRVEIENYDVLVLASTIISKAEGSIIDPDTILPTSEAKRISNKTEMEPEFVQAVLDESIEVILESPIFLVRHKCGNICINAGIDRSNVEKGLLLLPSDPDKSAKKLQNDFFRLTGKLVSVIITDTNGRAFREGQTGFAIGAAGLKTHHDWRGSTDLFGTVLEVANEAITDELAGFANYLMGEGDWGTPVVVIRGLDVYSNSDGVDAMYRSPEIDVIRSALLYYGKRN